MSKCILFSLSSFMILSYFVISVHPMAPFFDSKLTMLIQAKQHSSISPLCAASARTSHHHEFGSEAVPTKRKGPETRRLSTLIVNRPASTKTLQNKISSNFISGSRISVSNLGISWHPKCTQECRSREFCEKLSTQPPQVPGMVPTALHEPDTFGIFVARETLQACGDFDGLS